MKKKHKLNKVSALKQLKQLHKLRCHLYAEEKEFLLSQGWIQIEGPAGFSYLWEKAIRGRIYRLSTEVAIATERDSINFPNSCRV